MNEIGFYNLERLDKIRVENMVRRGLIDTDEIVYEPEPKEEQLSLFETE